MKMNGETLNKLEVCWKNMEIGNGTALKYSNTINSDVKAQEKDKYQNENGNIQTIAKCVQLQYGNSPNSNRRTEQSASKENYGMKCTTGTRKTKIYMKKLMKYQSA